jgi:hypothetical protein
VQPTGERFVRVKNRARRSPNFFRWEVSMKRYTVTYVTAGITISRPFFLVMDSLTGRVRESTFDRLDAEEVAERLNADERAQVPA